MLQHRLTAFAKIMFILGVLALLTNVTISIATTGHPAPNGRVIPLHLTALAAAAFVWVVGHKTHLTIRPLFALDGLGTTAVLSAYAVVGFTGAHNAPERASLLMMLITICALATRAILVPSTLTHTIGVSQAASLPVLILTYKAALRYPHAYGMSPMTAVLYMSLWVAAGIVISTVASHIIYGLRVQVAQAQQLGQYTLGEMIGQGGMGIVYMAKHALLRRPTAIKLLRPTAAGPQMLQRFQREVQLTAMLTHPNTISIYDYGRTADGTFYYAMEYLDGINLEQLVTRYGPQDCRRVTRILEQVAGSLAEAHQVGLVHRDIKPGNVIVCNRGGLPDFVKVVDFGLVKDANEGSEGDPAITGINTIIGTPLYLAPEAILKPAEVDARADLYALGAIGYYLIAGVPVFEAETVLQICVMQANNDPIPPSVRAKREVPEGLERLILRCLAKDPKQRPQTARDFLTELSEAHVEPWPLEAAEAWWQTHALSAARSRVAADGKSRPVNGTDTVVINYEDRGTET